VRLAGNVGAVAVGDFQHAARRNVTFAQPSTEPFQVKPGDDDPGHAPVIEDRQRQRQVIRPVGISGVGTEHEIAARHRVLEVRQVVDTSGRDRQVDLAAYSSFDVGEDEAAQLGQVVGNVGQVLSAAAATKRLEQRHLGDCAEHAARAPKDALHLEAGD
jgi:hypothetical protein